jgi:hypothetical protein
MTLHHGSCHCGAVAYEADIDLAAGTTRCNCTYCRKTRNWGVRAAPATFRVTKGVPMAYGTDGTAEYEAANLFCPACGVRLFARGNIPELGGLFVTVAVATLDDVPVEDLIAAPVTWCDGLHDNWWNPPDEVRHL